jgi:hypothetical protein
MRCIAYACAKRVLYAFLCAGVITGCASTPIVCKLPEPPASLLAVPAPLPPIPADMPR